MPFLLGIQSNEIFFLSICNEFGLYHLKIYFHADWSKSFHSACWIHLDQSDAEAFFIANTDVMLSLLEIHFIKRTTKKYDVIDFPTWFLFNRSEYNGENDAKKPNMHTNTHRQTKPSPSAHPFFFFSLYGILGPYLSHSMYIDLVKHASIFQWTRKFIRNFYVLSALVDSYREISIFNSSVFQAHQPILI